MDYKDSDLNRFWAKVDARVESNGTTHNVGLHSSLVEAEAAVIAKRNELFTHNDVDRATA